MFTKRSGLWIPVSALALTLAASPVQGQEYRPGIETRVEEAMGVDLIGNFDPLEMHHISTVIDDVKDRYPKAVEVLDITIQETSQFSDSTVIGQAFPNFQTEEGKEERDLILVRDIREIEEISKRLADPLRDYPSILAHELGHLFIHEYRSGSILGQGFSDPLQMLANLFSSMNPELTEEERREETLELRRRATAMKELSELESYLRSVKDSVPVPDPSFYRQIGHVSNYSDLERITEFVIQRETRRLQGMENEAREQLEVYRNISDSIAAYTETLDEAERYLTNIKEHRPVMNEGFYSTLEETIDILRGNSEDEARIALEDFTSSIDLVETSLESYIRLISTEMAFLPFRSLMMDFEGGLFKGPAVEEMAELFAYLVTGASYADDDRFVREKIKRLDFTVQAIYAN